jgi:hypothetical protein
MKSILASDSLSNREQTPRKVKTGRRLQRYSMYQYIVIESSSKEYLVLKSRTSALLQIQIKEQSEKIWIN